MTEKKPTRAWRLIDCEKLKPESEHPYAFLPAKQERARTVTEGEPTPVKEARRASTHMVVRHDRSKSADWDEEPQLPDFEAPPCETPVLEVHEETVEQDIIAKLYLSPTQKPKPRTRLRSARRHQKRKSKRRVLNTSNKEIKSILTGAVKSNAWITEILKNNPLNEGLRKKHKRFLMSAAKPIAEEVFLLASPFKNRPPVIFFPYPSYVEESRQPSTQVVPLPWENLTGAALSFRVTGATHIYNCVVNSFKAAGFRMVNSGDWNVLWTGNPNANTVQNACGYQRINHFPGTMQIGRKDLLWRNVSWMMRAHGKHFKICPQTYIFPEDYKKFKADRDNDPQNALYILKPASASCGKGIRVINKR